MITHNEKMQSLPPARRARIEAGTQELLSEYEAIQTLRERFNLTQQELADRMDVGQALISKLENGEMRLTIGYLSRIIEALSPQAEWEINIRMPGSKLFTIVGHKDQDTIDHK